MGKAKVVSSSSSTKKMRPALSPEARENQLISLATDCAEEQLRAGTASSQVITHYLKQGTMRERLEKEKLENENKLLQAKVKALESTEHNAAMYEEAIKAMRRYSGQVEYYDDQDIY